MPADISLTRPLSVSIEPMDSRHATEVMAVYALGIDEGDATFETSVPPWSDFDRARLPTHRFVAVDEADSSVVGWVAVGSVSGRRAYAGVVEHSVYVHPRARGRGIAVSLLDALVESTEGAGIWTIQAGIFPENAASLAVHRRAGFRVIGTRERIGRLHGVWRDVVLVERRSPRIR